MSRYSSDVPPEDDEPFGRPFLAEALARRAGPNGRHGHAPDGRDLRHPPTGSVPTGPLSTGSLPTVPGSAVELWSGHEAPRYETHHGEVRPYLLTGGRTVSRGAVVAMETIVMVTGAPAALTPDAAVPERASILRLAERPCSAAEAAARLHLPLQVALVLVSDLVAEGLLDATAVGTSQADDVLFLERLIAGVAAL